MRVRWIKPLDGLGGQSVIAAPWRMRRAMHTMAEEIGGSEELVAVYLTSKCDDPDRRKRIAGFVRVEPLAPDEELQKNSPNYAWNRPEQWAAGVRVGRPWKGVPRHLLPVLDAGVVAALGPDFWLALRHSFRSGAPQRLDAGNYQALGPFLTAFVAKHWAALEDVADAGDHGTTPGQHWRKRH